MCFRIRNINYSNFRYWLNRWYIMMDEMKHVPRNFLTYREGLYNDGSSEFVELFRLESSLTKT